MGKDEGKDEREQGGKHRGESRVVQMSTTTVITDIHVSTAAYVMYEQGLRLGREAPGLKSLQKQVWTMLVCMLRKLVCWEGGGKGEEEGCIMI